MCVCVQVDLVGEEEVDDLLNRLRVSDAPSLMVTTEISLPACLLSSCVWNFGKCLLVHCCQVLAHRSPLCSPVVCCLYRTMPLDSTCSSPLPSLPHQQTINSLARMRTAVKSQVDLDYVLGVGGFDLER